MVNVGLSDGIGAKRPQDASGDSQMKVPEWVKPAVWGAIGGAIAAIIVGFAWGGWVTGGTAGKMETASAEAAVVQAFTPLCVAKAQQQPEKLAPLKEESSYQRGNFVIEAGWVDNVSEKYRSEVATACASTLVEGIKAD
jgi:hypothetical protein